jgi:hypothetical protein
MSPVQSQDDKHPDSRLERVLQELEKLLPLEETALLELDEEAIEASTGIKETLFDQLRRALETERPTPQHRARLEQLRAAQLKNQLLLVHARDAVRGALSLALGQSTPARFTPAANRPTDAAVLSVRG